MAVAATILGWNGDWGQLLLSAYSILVMLPCLIYLFHPAIVAASQPPPQEKAESIVSAISVVSKKATSKTTTKTMRGGGGGGGGGGGKQQLPISLSIVIPAYNEQERLPVMLREAYAYFTATAVSTTNNKRQQSVVVEVASVEWILVNDGSMDDTTSVYRDFALSTMLTDLAINVGPIIIMTWKVITFDSNRGKGAAVRAGMLSATGDAVLMVDADGATEFGTGLEAVLSAAYSLPSPTTSEEKTAVAAADVVFGSRSSQQHVERSTLRRLLQWIFHICVVVCVGGGRTTTTTIRDTQCGFKLFRHDAAMRIFRPLHLRRWAFDTELLYLAVRLRYKIQEVPVPWHEVDGSKLHTGGMFGMFHLAVVSVGMLRDMVCVRLCYTLGWWTINNEEQQQRGVRSKLA